MIRGHFIALKGSPRRGAEKRYNTNGVEDENAGILSLLLDPFKDRGEELSGP